MTETGTGAVYFAVRVDYIAPMPRRARRIAGGEVYHVLNRSAARFKMFRTEKDFLAFENVLRQARERVGSVRLMSYCIMPNHWHLVVRPTHDEDLSAFMFWLTMTHAQRWRTSHDKVGYGPLYQGRFKAFVVQTDAHFLTVCRYVERNPIRAKLVRDPSEWRWSSLWDAWKTGDKFAAGDAESVAG